VEVRTSFEILLNSEDVHRIQPFFGFEVGIVTLGDGGGSKGSRLRPPASKNKHHLLNQIIGHFERYPLENMKHQDFIAFREGMKLISSGGHLTRAGMDRVKLIPARMNTGKSSPI
jgi:hypothetical protein